MTNQDATAASSTAETAPVREEGGAVWPEVTDAWADTYCALTGRDPDGQQVTFVDGGVATTFRNVAKREIEAMLCAAPKSAVATREEAQPVPEGVIVAYARNHYRFHPYKPRSEQFRKGIKGRWQKMNEYGHWENSSPPSTTPPAPEAEKLRTALKWIAGCRATTAEGMMMKDHASEALAALQAEQGAK